VAGKGEVCSVGWGVGVGGVGVGVLGGRGAGVGVRVASVVAEGVGIEVDRKGVIGGVGLAWQVVRVRTMRISRKVMVLVCPETNDITLS
jgi:hypothetical protein